AANSSFSTTFTYSATFADGTTRTLAYLGREKNGAVDFFKVTPDNTGAQFTSGIPAVFASQDPQLGQSVILIEGETKTSISIGHVSDLTYTDSTQKTIDGMETDIVPKTTSVGGPLIDLSGEVLGFRIAPGVTTGDQPYLSSTYLSDVIAQYLKS